MTHRYLMVVAGDAYFTLGKTISFVLAITINLVLLDCYVDTVASPLDRRIEYDRI